MPSSLTRLTGAHSLPSRPTPETTSSPKGASARLGRRDSATASSSDVAAALGALGNVQQQSAAAAQGTMRASTPTVTTYAATPAPLPTDVFASLSQSVSSRSSVLANAQPLQPSTVLADNFRKMAVQGALVRAAYCRPWPVAETSAGDNDGLIGELLPQWQLSEQDNGGGGKSLIAHFAQLKNLSANEQTLATNNGVYLSDLTSYLCRVSMAESLSFAQLPGVGTPSQPLPRQISVAVNLAPSSSSSTFNVTGYRCAEDADTKPVYPFRIFDYSNEGYGAIEALPDFEAQTRCQTPIATSTYYFSEVATLGIFGKNGQQAYDKLEALQQTVTATQTSIATSVYPVVPYTGAGSAQLAFERNLKTQRVESAAYGAWNLALLGLAATLLITARRNLNRSDAV